MPARRIAIVVSPVLHFVEWMFSSLAPGIDLFLGLLGSGWLFLMVSRPDLFDQGNFVGMHWLPDRGWVIFMALTTSLHFLGLARPHANRLRIGSMLLTSWYWLSVSISLARVGPSTGVVAYFLIGALSLCAAIYISGPVRRGG